MLLELVVCSTLVCSLGGRVSPRRLSWSTSVLDLESVRRHGLGRRSFPLGSRVSVVVVVVSSEEASSLGEDSGLERVSSVGQGDGLRNSRRSGIRSGWVSGLSTAEGEEAEMRRRRSQLRKLEEKEAKKEGERKRRNENTNKVASSFSLPLRSPLLRRASNETK